MLINKNIAVSENGFMFNPLTGDSFSVNQTGSFIIQKMKEGKCEKDILQALCQEYELDSYTAEKDFYDFISLLNSYQLIENE